MNDFVMQVSDFVAVCNQTLDYAFPQAIIEGELANVRISKGKWLYFDIKDDTASVKCFGTVYQLPGPVEDGMQIRITAVPRLHQLYGFSLNVQSIAPVGEGSIKKAAALLEAKLATEGLFDDARKRSLPYPPETIALITSGESAAYADFIKILTARWPLVRVVHYDVQVQGDPAIAQICAAIEQVNSAASPADVIVLTRGGGSPDDLSVFSAEQVVRAVAGSRIPTMVAVGHEIDTSLAEMVADKRASTPSNAAELLVPDVVYERIRLKETRAALSLLLQRCLQLSQAGIPELRDRLDTGLQAIVERTEIRFAAQRSMLTVLSPQSILQRGYAVVRAEQAIRSITQVEDGQKVTVRFYDGEMDAQILDRRVY